MSYCGTGDVVFVISSTCLSECFGRLLDLVCGSMRTALVQKLCASLRRISGFGASGAQGLGSWGPLYCN